MSEDIKTEFYRIVYTNAVCLYALNAIEVLKEALKLSEVNAINFHTRATFGEKVILVENLSENSANNLVKEIEKVRENFAQAEDILLEAELNEKKSVLWAMTFEVQSMTQP